VLVRERGRSRRSRCDAVRLSAARSVIGARSGLARVLVRCLTVRIRVITLSNML
jgi:hypothetical protein